MDQGLATALLALMALLGTIISASIVARATIYAARLRETHHDNVRPTEPYEKEDHRVQDEVAKRRNEPSKLIRVSPGFVAPVLFVLAVVAVFFYIPFVSNYAFMFLAAAYIIMAAGYHGFLETGT